MAAKSKQIYRVSDNQLQFILNSISNRLDKIEGLRTDFQTVSIEVDESVTSNKACASGYTRIGPNFCKRDKLTAILNITSTGCQRTPALTGVSDAKGVLFFIAISINSNNGVALRQVVHQFFAPTNTTCTGNVQGFASASAMEFVATLAGTTIASVGFERHIRTDTSGRAYINTLNSDGITSLYPMGYFD